MIDVYTTTIDNPEMDNNLIQTINKHCEENRNTTNVKAGMTDWFMQDYPGFDQLCYYLREHTKVCSFAKYNNDVVDPIIWTIWGNRYESGERCIKHDHYPSLWSAVYYINVPPDAAGLTFIDEHDNNEETTIDVRNGMLVMFKSDVPHKVKSSKFEGYRYTVGANINHNFTK